MQINCPGPMRRREFMRVGGLALGGASLAELLALRSASGQEAARGASDKSVILLYLHGGPSQLETYDLKPEAPSEYRSVFQPIASRTPGMQVCELFPLQAALGDKISLLRSCSHTMSSHTDGGIEVLTGKTPSKPDPTSTSKSEHPDFGSIASRVLGAHAHAMPRYVAIPQQAYMTRPTYLGLHHGAFAAGDPTVERYAPPGLQLAAGVDGKSLANRKVLLQQFDRMRTGLDLHGSLEGTDRFRDLAVQMLTSARVAGAFDLAREPDALRDRYGRNLWGQSCLLARRLAEAGTSVITLFIDTPKQGPEFTNWDDHILNAQRPGHFANYMRTRLPYLDQALSALIEDVYGRGLDKRILTVALGEFGRTPRLSHNTSGTGRDHWPDAQSVLFSGGGLRMGHVVGATNSKAEHPVQAPYSPRDVLATIYRHLGINPQQTLLDHKGRPIAILPDGRPIRELV